ncbi:MAG: TSCPD domain-containing protein [Archaeoglobaceae archaeon]
MKPRRRPRVVPGLTVEVKTGCGTITVTINYDEQGIVDVFARFGKTGSCGASQLEAISRLLSLAFRCGIDSDEILKSLKGIRCCSPFFNNGTQILSCADAIAKVLEQFLGTEKPIAPMEVRT